eukprot:sb/3468058/
MFHFKEYGITWAPVFKASSTNWKKFFINHVHPDKAARDDYGIGALWSHNLKSNEKRKAADGRLRTFTKEPSDSIRFTIVRHPLSRLVSHYRKTVTERGELNALRDLWVKPTILHSRQVSDKKLHAAYNDELNKWITGQFEPDENNKNPYLTPPTFREFVKWILFARSKRDRKGTNDHWRPASEFMDTCQNNIDIVVKLENEVEEVPYLLKRLNLSEYLEYFMGKHNSSGKKEVEGREVEDHIGQLSNDQQKQLNKIYELDYQMFEYSPVYVTPK